MSGLPFTQAPAEPQLKDVLDALKKDIFLSLNCHHVGIIQSFNATKQTATVTIAYKKTYYQLNSATGLYSPTLVDYPILTDCPVLVLGGGLGSLTFPIEQGDECLVLYNDRDLDNWFQGGVGAPNATPRLHSFADGIALVGLRSVGNILDNYDTTRAALRYDKTIVGVGAKVKIQNADQNLKTLLQQLITNIKSLVTATAGITVLPGTFTTATGGPVTGTSGAPVNASSINAVANDLTTTANNIAGLLE